MRGWNLHFLGHAPFNKPITLMRLPVAPRDRVQRQHRFNLHNVSHRTHILCLRCKDEHCSGSTMCRIRNCRRYIRISGEFQTLISSQKSSRSMYIWWRSFTIGCILFKVENHPIPLRWTINQSQSKMQEAIKAIYQLDSKVQTGRS